MDAFGRLPTNLTGFLLCALLEALLILGAGSLILGTEQDKSMVIECVGFPSEGLRQSTSQIRLVNLSDDRGTLEIKFLDVDRSVLRTRQLDLTSRATTSFEVPTWQVGSAMQVITLTPVSVDVTLVYDGSVGPSERRTVPCWRAASPQSTAGILQQA